MCERTTADHARGLSPAKAENERLEAVFKKHQVVLHRTDIWNYCAQTSFCTTKRMKTCKSMEVYRTLVSRLSQMSSRPPTLKKKRRIHSPPPHIKEEEEDVWITQEEECLLGQEEADLSKFPLTVVSVKTEEHEDKPPESSQLHHSPNLDEKCLPHEQEEEPQSPHIHEKEKVTHSQHIKEGG
ncbi:uncharacterized protein LOC133544984 isoform X6 [Nerophis ophidion]|uniref:uncharacterized protein LOC133544984 isoform X6 n=1 Tax=Nerophis ophidion TaxID=159077 RepID=UPI002AE06158|nr:uncharacterized protein LOC133544984 isoform X6 [Nerophis ophidion]